MKISYRTHPILEKVHKKNIGDYGYFSCDKSEILSRDKKIRDLFKRVSIGINNQIYNLSQSFVDAYERAADKLYESNLFKEIEDDNLCLISPCWDDKSQKESTLLKVRNNTETKIITCEVFNFIGIALVMFGSFVFDYNTDNGKPDIYSAGWISSNVSNMDKHILNCLLITLFIRYAEVETKQLRSGQRDIGIDCKYVNETKGPIVLLDSKWFTTLVKSDAFKVRGHFRFQACGHGLKDRKLIWINEFQKEGYTAPARKLAVENSSS